MGASLASLWATRSERVNLQSLGTAPIQPGSGIGKGARRDGASVLQGAIHLSPLSPMPDLLYIPPLLVTALPPWERCGTGTVPGRERYHHGASLLPPLAGTTSTCRTSRRSPASISRAGGRTSAADCIMPTSWTRLRTSWSVRAGEGGRQLGAWGWHEAHPGSLCISAACHKAGTNSTRTH